MEDYKFVRDEKDYALFYLQKIDTYLILKTIDEKFKLPKNTNKILKKPNFSYYPTIGALSQAIENDEKLKELTPERLKLINEDDGIEANAEIIVIKKGLDIYFVDLIFDTLANIEDEKRSLYEIVMNLESIFGLVWKLKKKEQIGLIGELIVIKKSGKYLEKFLDGYHNENYKNKKKFESKTDFEIVTDNGKRINFEVKATMNEHDLFTLKNSQLSDNINDYLVAVKIFETRKDGLTLIDLIDWYLKFPLLDLTMRDFLVHLKEKHDGRDLIKFNEEKTIIKYIEIKKIPYFKEHSELMKNISFNIDLLTLGNEGLDIVMNS